MKKDRWYIPITTENKHILQPYWESIVSKDILGVYKHNFKGFLLSWDYDKTYMKYHYSQSTAQSDRAIKITLEEFQRDILGQNINPTYEIY